MPHLTILTLAAVLAWILCVCVHEFSHALVAYIGGDVSVKEKGYLTLDPTRFIDPIFSLLIPAIVLLMGGIPLPGGAVRINEASLRTRRWGLYVSAAGPASNFILFLLFSLPLHPSLGIVEPHLPEYPTWVYFCGAMAFLNFFATFFNLIPVPPLDGYRLIEDRLSPEMQWKMRLPQTQAICITALFMLFMFDATIVPFMLMLKFVCSSFGLPIGLISDGFLFVMYNQAP